MNKPKSKKAKCLKIKVLVVVVVWGRWTDAELSNWEIFYNIYGPASLFLRVMWK